MAVSPIRLRDEMRIDSPFIHLKGLTMTIRLFIGLAVLAISGTAFAGNPSAVTLDPGLYDFTTNIYVNSQLQKTDKYEYCIIEGKNSKTLDEIVSDLVQGGNCSARNVTLTGSTGSADISCTDPDFGLKINGRVQADYGPDFYNANATANINGAGNMSVKTKVRRRSDCPVGWDNPDGVSAD